MSAINPNNGNHNVGVYASSVHVALIVHEANVKANVGTALDLAKLAYAKMSEEIAPFYKFANCKNPSMAYSNTLVYANCVSCNTKRFAVEELAHLRIGTDAQHCDLCFKKIWPLIVSFNKGTPQAVAKMFNDLYDNYRNGKIVSNL